MDNIVKNYFNSNEQTILTTDKTYAFDFSKVNEIIAISSLNIGDDCNVSLYNTNFDNKESNSCNNVLSKLSIKYPLTNIKFLPKSLNKSEENDVFIGSGLGVNIFSFNDSIKNNDNNVQIKLENIILNDLNTELNAPITSIDISANSELACGASLDSTVKLYDLNKEKIIKQIIAHDMEVFDISFAPDGNIFSTVSFDCSARRFDIRDLSRGDILYESSEPLLKIEWNKMNENIIAFSKYEQNHLVLLDIRMPVNPFCYLSYHKSSINGFVWAPYSGYHLCTVSDDKLTLIWDINKTTDDEIITPLLENKSENEIINVCWSTLNNDQIAVNMGNYINILKVN